MFSNDYLNGLQSTFLGSMESIKTDSNQLMKLGGLQDDEIERKCRQNGLSLSGGVEQQRTRIARLESYLHGPNTTSTPKLQSLDKLSKNKANVKQQSNAKRVSSEKKILEKHSSSSWNPVKVDQNQKASSVQYIEKQKPTKPVSKPQRKGPVPVEIQKNERTEPEKMEVDPDEDIDMFEDPDVLSKVSGSQMESNKDIHGENVKRQKRNDGSKSR